MEHLTKQQIVLLTLLVSFVTSLSTGIVTVSLMDQAPAAAGTVNQIIQKTVMLPQAASVGLVSVKVEDQTASSTARIASSMVRIQNASGDTVAIGAVISKTGLIIAVRDAVEQTEAYSAMLPDGTVVPLSFSLSNDPSSPVVIFAPTTLYAKGSLIDFVPIKVSLMPHLGQKAYTLGGKSSNSLREGIIASVGSTTTEASLSSKSDAGDGMVGSILFDLEGNAIGLEASSTFLNIAPFVSSSGML